MILSVKGSVNQLWLKEMSAMGAINNVRDFLTV